MQDDIKFPEGEDPAKAGELDTSELDEVSGGILRPETTINPQPLPPRHMPS